MNIIPNLPILHSKKTVGKFVYNLNLDDIKEVNSNKSVQNEKTQYEFLSYVICKNPLCNYDIELKGYIFEYPENTVDSVELIKLK